MNFIKKWLKKRRIRKLFVERMLLEYGLSYLPERFKGTNGLYTTTVEDEDRRIKRARRIIKKVSIETCKQKGY